MHNLPYNAVMVDLETMGTGNNAAIVAIGAVKFWLNVNQTSFTDDQLFYYPVDLCSSVKAGLAIDPNTVKWWLSQSNEARSSLDGGQPLANVLDAFKFFVPNQKAYIFGNGATFDNVILRNAFNAVNLEYPVSYKYDVCYRTLRHMFDEPFPEFEGTKHNALDDAISQTKHLMRILERNPWSVTKAL